MSLKLIPLFFFFFTISAHSFDRVFAGGLNTCVSKGDKIKCVGLNNYNQLIVPSDLNGLIDLKISNNHLCAQDLDGLWCWGDSSFGRFQIPEELNKIEKFSVGGWWTSTVNKSGEAKYAGFNEYGNHTLPTNLGVVVDVISNYQVLCSFNTEGKIICWGWPSDVAEVFPTPADLGFVVELAIGDGGHACIRNSENQIKCWGNNQYGQATVPQDLGDVVKLQAGNFHTCALNSAGNVKCWGDNDDGETDVPANLGFVVELAGGNSHVCTRNTDNEVKCWGDNSHGEIDLPTDF